MAATWTAGITAAAGTGLSQSLFVCLFTTNKSFSNKRNTLTRSVILAYIAEDSYLLRSVKLGICVSDSFLGPLRQKPLLIFGLVGIYPANNLISRSPFLKLKFERKLITEVISYQVLSSVSRGYP